MLEIDVYTPEILSIAPYQDHLIGLIYYWYYNEIPENIRKYFHDSPQGIAHQIFANMAADLLHKSYKFIQIIVHEDIQALLNQFEIEIKSNLPNNFANTGEHGVLTNGLEKLRQKMLRKTVNVASRQELTKSE